MSEWAPGAFEERPTAGRRIVVYHLFNPGAPNRRGGFNPTEQDMIQEMADKGYNFAGLVRYEGISDRGYGCPQYWYLFIKADTL